MTGNERKFWFPAKKYGWGWGPPTCWQGWLVLVLYGLLLVATAAYFLPRDDARTFLACTLALTVGLVLVCWIKGEKPRWRWKD